jgi:hypothetical protein
MAIGSGIQVILKMKPKRNWGGCSVGTAYDMEFLSMPLR